MVGKVLGDIIIAGIPYVHHLPLKSSYISGNRKEVGMKVIFGDEDCFREWQAINKIDELTYNLEVWRFQNVQTGQIAIGIFSKGKSKFFDRENYTPLFKKFLRLKEYDFLFREAYD